MRTQYNSNKKDNPNEPNEDSTIIRPVRMGSGEISSSSSSSDSEFDKYFKPSFKNNISSKKDD